MSELAYQQALPKKRMSAGALFMDAMGRLLIVAPVYRPVWEIPGGVVEYDESPRQACRREVAEEIGLTCRLSRLLCVDYISRGNDKIEALAFVFWGGVLDPGQIDAIRLPSDELRDYAFFPPDEAMSYLNDRLGRRIGQCLQALRSQCTLYLEDQRPIFD